MSQAISEHVLCSTRTDLPPSWLPDAGAVRLAEDDWINRLEPTTPHWLPRQAAETTPSFKQWIPYLLLRNAMGELAAYPRRGGEKRLHGLWSLGVGGHINPVDRAENPATGVTVWRQTLWNGLRRELSEEFPAASGGATHFLGLINEEQTDVGRVHLGAVFVHEAKDPAADPGEELEGLRWLPHEVIGRGDWPMERFELWSRLALQLL